MEGSRLFIFQQAFNEPSINLTYEKESNNTIHFLKILIIKSYDSLTFKVFGKPTNKNDNIHFYSNYNIKIKNRPHNWILPEST